MPARQGAGEGGFGRARGVKVRHEVRSGIRSRGRRRGDGGAGGGRAGAEAGLRTALLEAHTKLGGCCGLLRAGGRYTFDAGATALMGLGAGRADRRSPRAIGRRLRRRSGRRAIASTCPTGRSTSSPDAAEFEAASAAAFPARDRAQSRASGGCRRRSARPCSARRRGVPRLPLRSAGDLVHDLRILGRRGRAGRPRRRRDRPGRAPPARARPRRRVPGAGRDALQDTAQAGPETVPFANAAACLQAYRLGMSRPRGRDAGAGRGDRRAVRRARGRPAHGDQGRSRRARRADGGFAVVTRRRGSGCTPVRSPSTCRSTWPRPCSAAALEGRLGRRERRSRAAWSAFTGYVAIDRDAVADDSPLFHQVLQAYDRPIHDGNNVLVSLSPPGDEGYGPADVRVATMSTHTAPGRLVGARPRRPTTRRRPTTAPACSRPWAGPSRGARRA